MEYTKEKPLLMIPGPVESSQTVLDTFSRRTYSHTEKTFVDGYQETLHNLKSIFGAADSSSAVAIAGSGTLAMEIAMINLIDTTKNQKTIICDTGYFGNRFQEIARSFSIPYSTISTEVGHKIAAVQLDEKLEEEQPDFAFIQHVDTSTGVANDIAKFGELCKKHGVISIVDGVCALGGMPVYQDDWDIDIYFTGAQKALAVPPGLSIMVYSEKAREISEIRNGKIPSYYTDLTRWWPILDAYAEGTPKYFSTPATNLIMTLHNATQRILSEGLENRYKRHETIANKLRKNLSELGFSFITAADSYANTLSTPKYLDPSEGAKFRGQLLDKGIQIAGGIQNGIAEKYFRIGHMGEINEDHVKLLTDAIEKISLY